MKLPKLIFCWSGGKDSAYGLHKILTEQQWEVAYLLTTVNAEYGRVSMHGVREALLERQAEAIGIPLLKVYVSESTNEEYERQMEVVLLKAKQEGIDTVAFGDIFLEDLRAYREEKLAAIGMKALFPIWKMDTKALVEDFIAKGFKSVICCVNDASLSADYAGREIDAVFVDALPEGVDPCGERGEYHSFCYAGPLYKEAVAFERGEKLYKPLPPGSAIGATKGFWYVDLVG